ncbi:DUF1800 domain-containing protein [Scleromatobacter humisilvae]|uniref:DUF1800 domain-containing protein n=1 Tax=Scleromatobacter humisilvae TaxID=2897159 RepID=A0A9X1YHR9_9BURK|nr:DUF1800 domain-containing protein [Scleromatobacter humisilvae]MCK9684637.1 DUF1800 domain-containing protein [Scleromatobacter humisilvae]
MTVEVPEELRPLAVGSEPPAPVVSVSPALSALAAATLAASLAACGGGGGASPSPAPEPPPPPPPPPPAAPTEAEASRFLAQASMGASRTEIANVVSLGYAGWLDAQFALPVTDSRWDWLVAQGYTAFTHKNDEQGFDATVWRKMLSAPDTLRQRIVFALSEIFVIGIDGLVGGGWRQFNAASWADLVEANAFGSHRAWLQQMSLSGAMGDFLTFRGSAKEDPVSGALPDENYARELMQLFTIGLVMLNADGTTQLTGGASTPTYQLADITGLARVFTGWDFDLQGQNVGTGTATPDFVRRPMIQVPSRYETGAKTFLGTTIPAGTDAATCLSTALDTIFHHQNVAPFFCRQLIQRLVTSNPSPAYVARIAAVFADDGTGTRGNLKAVIRALLLDDEARHPADPSTFGKLREPILRLTGWARAYGVTSPSGLWAVGDTSDAAKGLAQSPLRSPSVFNFFRPGYVPPNTALDAGELEAPEFQIANESSVVGCVNTLQRAVAGSIADLTPDYTALLAIADDATALLTELNLVLAANQLGAATVSTLAAAVGTMASGSDTTRRARINAALVLVLAAPEYIVQK